MSKLEEFLKGHKIYKMEEEKRIRLINAGMEEFAKGYKQASTDRIVEKAGISKGLLFHYFGTKKCFFQFLHTYAVKVMLEEMIEGMEFPNGDVLERFWKMTLVKYEMVKVYKDVYEFMKMAHFDDVGEIPSESKAEFDQVIQEGYGKLYTDIDYSLFRDDIEPQDAINIITCAITGMEELEGAKYKGEPDYQKFLEEDMKKMRHNLDVLKKMIYKQQQHKQTDTGRIG